ncbi:hypothetical protein I302_100178 [Kwoniella bestiolae CBS 10118]|uniref:Calcineurin-like phosphoesterase domain-containing protein n=1 Tax=Kwoniella bestiolae CBS 10118 TaxID=1296100 RepID=A0A1B9G4F8_9TREE|nr:hypothetical protein I302_03553 [Kwoniella bestiolae CBS 10118]OCF25878.1 hypothetical protein I302_03553 [Kwoniella bestiolae CBS 10118]
MPRLQTNSSRYKPPPFLYLRSVLPIVLLILILSFGLVSYSLLSHFKSPAAKQRLGWQSWDIVEISSSSNSGSGSGSEVLDIGDANQTYMGSIPIENWDPLALHTTGLTEIAVSPCYFPPYIFPESCQPETTPELDKLKGKWVRVERDLNLRTGLWYLNIYYRRTRRLDADLITDLQIVPEPPSKELQYDLENGGWQKATGNLHSGVWPSRPEERIWYRTKSQGWDDVWKRQVTDNSTEESIPEDSGETPTGGVKEIQSGELNTVEYGDYITEVDIIYGDDDPFFGFERVQGGKITESKAGKWESVGMAVRRGNPVAPRAQVPKFHKDGTFKIMQIADLHYSVGEGQCKDTDKTPCSGDSDTAQWLGEALDAEKPDLVVFSGDQLNGQSTSYDSRSVLAKFAKPVIEREIPWVAIFGNHDSEIAGDRAEQMRALQHLPYSLARAGPRDVDGVGNYYIKLHSADGANMHIFTLYFLDSHARQKQKLPWKVPDYDYLKESQIEWYRNVSASIKPISRPFQPDGGWDLGDIWSASKRSKPARLAQRDENDKTLAKPNAMMWFHIPLPEAYMDVDKPSFVSDEDLERLDVGVSMDGQGNSKHNGGFFYNAIKATYEYEPEPSEEEEGTGRKRKKKSEVKVLGHGHNHNTDKCRRTDGIWTCFDGGSSYSGYGHLGFERRVRIYNISAYGEKIETYKRLTSGEVIDQQVLVGEGAVKGWGEDQE